jgi:tartrate dehydratase alpha subunit/fumarate hydratase class I-like protein
MCNNIGDILQNGGTPMRELDAAQIVQTVKRLCIEANCQLPGDIKTCIENAHAEEPWGQAKEILERIIENYQIAGKENQPICQDTGAACVLDGQPRASDHQNSCQNRPFYQWFHNTASFFPL